LFALFERSQSTDDLLAAAPELAPLERLFFDRVGLKISLPGMVREAARTLGIGDFPHLRRNLTLSKFTAIVRDCRALISMTHFRSGHRRHYLFHLLIAEQ